MIHDLIRRLDELLDEIRHNNATTNEYIEALKLVCETIQVVVNCQNKEPVPEIIPTIIQRNTSILLCRECYNRAGNKVR